METLFIFLVYYSAMAAMAFWEAFAEGRNAWDKEKLGWKLRIGEMTIMTAYHFWLFWVMMPLLLTLPIIASGFSPKITGIMLSLFFSGMVVEDFMWYVVNPVVKFREFWSPFSDYYPWIKIGKKKIVPAYYPVSLILAVLSWYFLWR